MALIETITDFNLAAVDPVAAAALETVEKASFIAPGMRVAYDFLDPLCYPSGVVPASGTALPVNTTLLSLTSDSAVTTVTEAFASGLGTAGLIMDTSAGRIALPDAAKFAANASFFGFGGWVKPLSAPSGDGGIIGYLTATNATSAQYAMVRNSSGAIYGAIASTIFLTIPAATVPVDEVCHIFFTAAIASGSCTLTSYKNGAVVGQQTGTLGNGGVLPTPNTSPAVGKGPFAQPSRVRLGTVEVVDFSTANAFTPAKYLSRAYGENIGRFT